MLLLHLLLTLLVLLLTLLLLHLLLTLLVLLLTLLLLHLLLTLLILLLTLLLLHLLLTLLILLLMLLLLHLLLTLLVLLLMLLLLHLLLTLLILLLMLFLTTLRTALPRRTGVILTVLPIISFVRQHLSADTQTQQTYTCQTPDARFHAFLTVVQMPIDKTAFWMRHDQHFNSPFDTWSGLLVEAHNKKRGACDGPPFGNFVRAQRF